MDSEKSSADQGIRLRRVSRSRLLLWGGCAVVLMAAALETSSARSYQHSLTGLNAAMRESRYERNEPGLPAAELAKHIRGFSFLSEEQVGGPQPAANQSAPSAPRRRMIYYWPSVYGNYRLAVKIDELNRAVGLEDDYHPSDAILAADGQRANSGASPPSRPLPKDGLAQSSEGIFILDTNDPSIVKTMQQKRCGSFCRELYRQAVLIAAREELSLPTRDASLGEVDFVSDAVIAYPFRVDIKLQEPPQAPDGVLLAIELSRPDPSGQWFIWSSTPVPVSSDPGLDELVEIFEPLSRGEIVTGLKEAGLPTATPEIMTPMAVPEDFPDRLDPVAQYAVIRHLHAVRRENGESADNLGALVRAYANLGHLIDFHWSPMSKAFKARAVVYAQRMVAKYGTSPQTLAHRAYAWSLAGNHALALRDMKKLRELPSEETPTWLPFIEAFCEYEPEKLEYVEGPFEEFSRYLLMRLLHPYFEKQSAVPVIQDVFQRNPACSRALERMRETNTLGQVRLAAESLPGACWNEIYQRLLAMPGIPESAAKTVRGQLRPTLGLFARNEHKSRIKMIAELRQASAESNDGIEPSWTALAELLNDLTFVQVQREVISEWEWLGLPPEQVAPTVQKLAPLVENHRFGKFLNFYTNDRPAALAGLTEVFSKVKPTDYEIQCLPIANASYQANPKFYGQLCSHIDNHWDKLYDDLLAATSSRFPEWEKEGWNGLIAVSPHHPLSIARQIHKAPDFTFEKAKTWEERYADNGYLLLELGRKYRALNRHTDAIRCMKGSFQVTPTHEAAIDLADEYETIEEPEAAQTVLEEALDLPSFGLESGNTHGKLAYSLAYQGKWKEAAPHAQAAAQTYSAHGLTCGARCAEGLQDWKAAETYYRASSERYESTSGDDWYFFGVRAGRGNLPAARSLAEKYWKRFNPPLNNDQMWSIAIGQIVDGENAKAIETFTNPKSVHHHSAPQFLLAAVLADKLGDAAKRDLLFGEIDRRFSEHSATYQLVNLFRNAVRNPQQLRWDRLSFYEITDDLNFNDVCMTYFCAGEFLESHGERELSKAYLDVAATTYDVHRHSCVLANFSLRSRNLPIGETRLNRQPDDRIPYLKPYWKAIRLRNELKYDEARICLNEALQLNPQFTTALLERAYLNELQSRYADSVADLEAVLAIHPDSLRGLAGLTTMRACCPEESIRNGRKALEYAQRGYDLTMVNAPIKYWRMAAAHAECGDFDKAIEFQEQAIKLAPKLTDWSQQLKLYKDKKPFRVTPPNPAPAAENVDKTE